MPVKIAYLAPEIPGPSCTFVYNEIFMLEDARDVHITPFSVHKMDMHSADERISLLQQKTCNLYSVGIFKVLLANFHALGQFHVHYVKALITCFVDACKLMNKPHLFAGLFYRFLYAGYLAVALKRAEVKHLHVHFSHVSGDIAMYAGLITSIPYSITAHANDIFELGYLLREKVNRSKFFATISQFNIRWLSDLGVNTEKLKIVHCGVNPQKFTPRASKAPATPYRFGFLGRLVEKKGADILIEACASLHEQAVDFTLDIIGNGPEEGRIKSLVANKGLSKVVNFLGAQPHDKIAAWLETIDCFVLPCVKDAKGDMDGIPVALMEAMLTGVPVISTDLSGIPELVIDGVTGLVAKSSDHTSLAEKMHTILTEPYGVTLKRVEAGQALVRSEFDMQLNAEVLADLIEIPPQSVM